MQNCLALKILSKNTLKGEESNKYCKNNENNQIKSILNEKEINNYFKNYTMIRKGKEKKV